MAKTQPQAGSASGGVVISAVLRALIEVVQQSYAGQPAGTAGGPLADLMDHLQQAEQAAQNLPNP